MNKTKTWLLAGAALALFASAGSAIADDARSKDGKAEARAERGVHVHRHEGHDGPKVTIRHAEHLKDILQLRPDQEPALKTFLEATRRDHAGHGMVRFGHEDDKTTPERLAEMEAGMARHQAAMKARIDATRTFYAQLDPKQKKAFDAMPMLMMAGPGFGPTMPPHMAHLAPPPVPPVPPTPPSPPPPPGF